MLLQIQTKSEAVAAAWQLIEAQKADLASQQNKVAQQSSQLGQQTRQVFKQCPFRTKANAQLHFLLKAADQQQEQSYCCFLAQPASEYHQHQLACSGKGTVCILYQSRYCFRPQGCCLPSATDQITRCGRHCFVIATLLCNEYWSKYHEAEAGKQGAEIAKHSETDASTLVKSPIRVTLSLCAGQGFAALPELQDCSPSSSDEFCKDNTQVCVHK